MNINDSQLYKSASLIVSVRKNQSEFQDTVYIFLLILTVAFQGC